MKDFRYGDEGDPPRVIGKFETELKRMTLCMACTQEVTIEMEPAGGLDQLAYIYGYRTPFVSRGGLGLN